MAKLIQQDKFGHISISKLTKAYPALQSILGETLALPTCQNRLQDRTNHRVRINQIALKRGTSPHCGLYTPPDSSISLCCTHRWASKRSVPFSTLRALLLYLPPKHWLTLLANKCWSCPAKTLDQAGME
jgi:hypothetical protein